MSRQRYSIAESINRILRLWQGQTLNEQQNSLTGEVLSVNEALSDLAELFNSSLPNQQGSLPIGVNQVNPIFDHIQYGSMYISTGTVTLSIPNSWTKVTGTFRFNGIASSNIVPDYANDKITINEAGIYFIGVQISFSGGANITFDNALYVNSTRQPNTRLTRKLGATGDVGSASSLGIIRVTGTSYVLELYAKASTTANFRVEAGQVWLYGLV